MIKSRRLLAAGFAAAIGIAGVTIGCRLGQRVERRRAL